MYYILNIFTISPTLLRSTHIPYPPNFVSLFKKIYQLWEKLKLKLHCVQFVSIWAAQIGLNVVLICISRITDETEHFLLVN